MEWCIIHRGDFFMKKWGGKQKTVGYVVITTGIVIILAMILPVGFWWFALAAALISAGIWIMKCC